VDSERARRGVRSEVTGDRAAAVVHATTVPFHLTMTAWRLVPEDGHEAGVDALRAILEKSGKALEVPGFVARNGSPDTVLIVYARDGELLASTIADTSKINARAGHERDARSAAGRAPGDAHAGRRHALPAGRLRRLGVQEPARRPARGGDRRGLAGTAVAAPTDAAPAAPAVPDLMAALEASLKAVATKEPIAA
jgi:hypothetical protein